MRLAAGLDGWTYPSVEAAIRAAYPPDGLGPLDVHAIDYGHVGGGSSGPWQMQARLDREARVRAILGQLERERGTKRLAVLVGFAWNFSVNRIAAAVGAPRSTVHRWWQQDRERVRRRLQEAGLLDTAGT